MSTVLLVIPPFTQLNAPHPAVPCLTRALRARGVSVAQMDLGLETTLRLFSREVLRRFFRRVPASRVRPGSRIAWAMDVADRYVDTVDAVVRYLQGKEPTLAHRICHGRFLPQGPRFDSLEDDDWAFGNLGISDRARFLCTRYLEDLADLVTELAVPDYGFSRYGEALATGATRFSKIARVLAGPPNWIDTLAAEVLRARLDQVRPDLVGISVPFPGTLLGALRAAQVARQWQSSVRVALGGGFVNTELRSVASPELFDIVDYVTLDDGEAPLLALVALLDGDRDEHALCRTFLRQGGTVRFVDRAPPPDLHGVPRGFPTFEGLPLDQYLSVLELLNPMHRLWSDGRWNKMVLAHGCYWKQCAFCDITLPHVADFRPERAPELVDRMVRIVAETGQTGFHFVDEAAPPALLRALALEILERGVAVSWWSNVRFEKAFTFDLCRLLSASGCIAVSGGLEVASDRLLARMQKGVTVAQVARAVQAFTRASIMVHAYLMYGFPSQTLQEIVDSLERVRQLFDLGLIQSGFWHRFYATAHAPTGRHPEQFGITITGPEPGDFAWNDLEYVDPVGVDADRHGPALDKALYHFMHGEGLERDVRVWFDGRVPPPSVSRREIRGALRRAGDPEDHERARGKLVWLGERVQCSPRGTRPGAGRVGGGANRTVEVRLALADGGETLLLPASQARWLVTLLTQSRPRGRGPRPYLVVSEVAPRFPGGPSGFETFTRSAAWRTVREAGLLIL